MKKIFEAENLPAAQLLKDQLEAAGYDIQLQGEFLGGAVGEIPVNTYPTLWLADDRDYDAARALVLTLEQQPEPSLPWQCAGCCEQHQGQFSQCWRCGRARD